MPRNGSCNHRRCYGEPCKQLTAEELAIRPQDHEIAQLLIEQGWYQMSGRFRHLARFPPGTTDIVQLWIDARGECNSSLHDEEHARKLGEKWCGSMWLSARARMTPGCEMTVSLRVFRAYKKLGGGAYR